MRSVRREAHLCFNLIEAYRAPASSRCVDCIVVAVAETGPHPDS
jgi:hypothetical protein